MRYAARRDAMERDYPGLTLWYRQKFEIRLAGRVVWVGLTLRPGWAPWGWVGKGMIRLGWGPFDFGWVHVARRLRAMAEGEM